MAAARALATSACISFGRPRVLSVLRDSSTAIAGAVMLFSGLSGAGRREASSFLFLSSLTTFVASTLLADNDGDCAFSHGVSFISAGRGTAGAGGAIRDV